MMSKQVAWTTQEQAIAAYLAAHPELVPAETSVELTKTEYGWWMAIGHQDVDTPGVPTMPWPPPPPRVQTPSVGRAVHYTSYGTPGGEYASVCRAATITEVGAWMQVGTPTPAGGVHPAPRRIVVQEWEADACVLEVHNPTGLFFNTCHHNEQHAPGSWHWPERV